MGYQPRIEAREKVNFLTTRTAHSRLWFRNGGNLENTILGYAAKFALRYGVKLYAFAIEGNHIQAPALFPEGNRAAFMRDFNSAVARAVPRETSHPGGRLWARRYSNEFLPAPEDVEEYFFYTVLQPVKDGLVERISDYPGYNCFHDAVWGRARSFKVVRWAQYRAAKRRGYNPKIQDFTDTVELRYDRLPGYERLTQAEYAALMEQKLEVRRLEILRKRREKGLGFAGPEAIRQTRTGSLPNSTKTSGRYDYRPRILSICPRRKAEEEAWYFDIYYRYKDASRRYRKREPDVLFPSGTYPPPLPCLI